MPEAPDIPGAADVIAWFGYWPTFHDAEVISILLDRSSESRVAIHAFEMTPEIDATGSYVHVKHAIVTFCAEGFPPDQPGCTNTHLEWFNGQNVLSGAGVTKITGGYELVLESCYGVGGSVVGERMSVKLEPGIPPGSIYERHNGE
jgi:hypothetical protein